MDGLLLDELTRGLETQSAVRVNSVVIFEPVAETLENRNSIRAGVPAGIVALERLHERSHTPLLSGLRTGVKQATRFSAVANSMVSTAV